MLISHLNDQVPMKCKRYALNFKCYYLSTNYRIGIQQDRYRNHTKYPTIKNSPCFIEINIRNYVNQKKINCI